jgi:hypothetical protein
MERHDRFARFLLKTDMAALLTNKLKTALLQDVDQFLP